MSEKAKAMPGLTYQDVLQILRLIDAAPGSSLDIDFEGTKLKVVRQTSATGAPPAAKAPAQDAQTSAPAASEATKPAAPVASPSPSAKAESVADDFPGAIAVKPPMTGTFYAASSPGAPAFVKVGDVVKKDDQLGIVEVMKLFTAISAPVDGTVRAILVSNQELVEKEMTLMLIEPSN